VFFQSFPQTFDARTQAYWSNLAIAGAGANLYESAASRSADQHDRIEKQYFAFIKLFSSQYANVFPKMFATDQTLERKYFLPKKTK